MKTEFIKMEDDPLYKQIEEALFQIQKPASKEELRKQNEELDKIKKEQGLEAFQDELLRRVGLK